MEFAAHRFAEKGYDPTSVADIVEGMGVGKGVFYWYFESKDRLMAELVADAQHQLRRRQQAAMGDEQDAVRRIELGIRASLRWLGENRHLFTLFQFAASDERFSPAFRRGQETALADVTRHVKDAIVSGRVRDADPLLLTHAIVGVTNNLAYNFIFRRGEDADAVADAAVTFCLQGLLGPPPH
jgi:AcrR family transcriptional regulator